MIADPVSCVAVVNRRTVYPLTPNPFEISSAYLSLSGDDQRRPTSHCWIVFSEVLSSFCVMRVHLDNWACRAAHLNRNRQGGWDCHLHFSRVNGGDVEFMERGLC